jgi:hypothetical protein
MACILDKDESLVSNLQHSYSCHDDFANGELFVREGATNMTNKGVNWLFTAVNDNFMNGFINHETRVATLLSCIAEQM